MTSRCHIVMLTFNSPEVEIPCVSKLIENTNYPYEMTIFDNRPDNEYMGKIWNRTIKKSDCGYFCFINSDVLIQDPQWLNRLIEVYSLKPDVSGVGPITDNIIGIQAGHSGPGEFKLIPHWEVVGFCFVVSKKVFDTVGLFDEDFGFYGQETEWFFRANQINKLTAYIRNDVFVQHKHSYSISKNPEYYEKERQMGPALWKKKREEILARAQKGK